MKLCKWKTVMSTQFVANDLSALAKETHLQHVVYEFHSWAIIDSLPAGVYSSTLCVKMNASSSILKIVEVIISF